MPRTCGALNKNLKYKCVDSEGNTTEYKTMKEMAEDLDIERTTIYRHIKANNYTFGRHRKQEYIISKITG